MKMGVITLITKWVFTALVETVTLVTSVAGRVKLTEQLPAVGRVPSLAVTTVIGPLVTIWARLRVVTVTAVIVIKSTQSVTSQP